jgi:uncharacterized membrane protein
MRYVLTLVVIMATCQFSYADESDSTSIESVLAKHGDQIITDTREWLKTAKDFADEQVPLFVEEFLSWRFWQAIVYLSISLLFLVAFLVYPAIYFIKIKTLSKLNNEDFMVATLLMCLSMLISGIISGTSAIPNLMTAIQISVAPRVYLVEQLMRMMQ